MALDHHYITILLPSEVRGPTVSNDEESALATSGMGTRLEIPTLQIVMDALQICYKEGTITSRPIATPGTCVDGTAGHQISFASEGSFTGDVVNRLLRIGVGADAGFGSLNVQPLDYHMSHRFDTAEKSIKDKLKNQKSFLTTQLKTLQFIETVEKGAHLTFDYCVLLIVASIIAGVGLATDNTVVIVASMLVSPLMGPVLAGTVAVSTRTVDMIDVRTAFKTGFVSLLICIGIGLMIGACCAPLKSVAHNWPTQEMASRGELTGLIIGTIIALASGVGVSLSGLTSNTNSLVGVAISASLLPPAVNAGMCWMFALLGGRVGYESIVNDADRAEYMRIGVVSLGLTILNIICVFISGWGIFKAKMTINLAQLNHSPTSAMEYVAHMNHEATLCDNEAVNVLIKTIKKRDKQPNIFLENDLVDGSDKEQPPGFFEAWRECWGKEPEKATKATPVMEAKDCTSSGAGEEKSQADPIENATEKYNEKEKSLTKQDNHTVEGNKNVIGAQKLLDLFDEPKIPIIQEKSKDPAVSQTPKKPEVKVTEVNTKEKRAQKLLNLFEEPTNPEFVTKSKTHDITERAKGPEVLKESKTPELDKKPKSPDAVENMKTSDVLEGEKSPEELEHEERERMWQNIFK